MHMLGCHAQAGSIPRTPSMHTVPHACRPAYAPALPAGQPGEYLNTRPDVCEPCPLGSFTNATNWSDTCTKCIGYDSYTPFAGATKCDKCPTAEWRSASRGNVCVGCLKGSLKFKNGAPKCCTSLSCYDAPDFPTDSVRN